MSDKILLIDDEEDFVETLAERMRSRDMNVSTSTSAIEALEKIDHESFDAIVLDLQMPGMDGLEALKRIKEKNPNLQVILLTGQATIEKSIEAMKLGALDLLEKPANLDTLTEKIQKASTEKMILMNKENEEKIKKILKGKAW
jgi:DNA-binding NtrC family response regulator